jgi:D-threo-aldose 1-dehydrogenase
MGLGAAGIANLYRDISEAQAIDTIQRALASGVRFIDTAPWYGYTLGERRLGLALAGVPRQSYVLATKVGRIMRAADDWHFDFSRAGILASLAGSLERLKLDAVDILHIHDPEDHDYRVVIEQAFPTLADLRRQGVIKAVGLGVNYWQMLMHYAQDADFDCFLLAGRYTLLEQGALPLLDLCRERGISLFLGGVYNTGILATGAEAGAKYQYSAAPPDILEKVRQMQTICERYGVPLRAAAVQFAGAHPAVAAVILGAESPEQVSENTATLSVTIPAALWDDLRAAGLLAADAPAPGKSLSQQSRDHL